MGVPGASTQFFMSGLSWLGVLVTSSLPAPLTISQAHPLPNWVAPAWANAVANASTPPRSRPINSAKSPAGVAGPPGRSTSQYKVWLKCPPPLLRRAAFQAHLGQQGFQASVRRGRRPVQRRVQFPHVTRVVLAVVNVHGFCVDPRGECVLGKPQVGSLNVSGPKVVPPVPVEGSVASPGRTPTRGSTQSCARGAGEFQKRSLVHDTKMVWDCVGEEALHRFM